MYNDYSGEGAILAGLGIFLLIFILIIVAIVVFYIVCIAKVFKKAGKPGWAAIVPIYNTIVLYEIAGFKWYYIFVSLASCIPVIGAAVVLFFNIVVNIKLAKSYGQETGFGIGLALLPVVFLPMLALKKDINYVGPVVNGDIDFNDLF